MELITTAGTLREIADWLDQHPDVELTSAGFYAWLKFETPANFVGAVKALGVDPVISETYTAFIERQFGPVTFRISASKRGVGTTRTVVREVEEFVIGDAT